MAYPTLNINAVIAGVSNQIIDLPVLLRVKKSGELVDKARVDGSLYGDTKVYRCFDAINTDEYTQDSAEAIDFISLKRNQTTQEQPLVINDFRIASTTVGSLREKQAFMNAGQFDEFMSALEAQVEEAEYLHDSTNYDAFIGVDAVGAGAGENPTALSLTSGKEGQEIAQFLADLCSDMTSASREFNDYGHLTKYSMDDIQVVWNNKWVNYIEKINLPVIFHNGFMEKFAENVVNHKYFGDHVDFTDVADATPDTTHPVKVAAGVYTYEPVAGNTVTLRVSKEVKIPCTDGSTVAYFYAGQPLVNPTSKVLDLTDFEDVLYVENEKIICKVFTKLPPYMSACSVSTEATNPKNHSRNRFLVFGRNTLEILKGEACVTIKSA